MQDPKHQPGQTIGKFCLVSFLGMGGFGEVWVAEHLELAGKKEVIKFAKDPKFLEILRQEGTVMHTLNYPGIIRVTDMDTTNEEPYLRMEYIDGITLEQKLQQDGKLPWQEALEIVWYIADILQVAHDQRIIHGDLKPSNIFLCKDGIKVADFGLGSYHIRERANAELSGCLKAADMKAAGTWNYMSPEQKQGKITVKSDIYSMGVILYRLITGNFPLSLEPPSGLADCPKEVDELVAKMLSTPDKRFKNMAEVKTSIQLLLGHTAPWWASLCFITGLVLIVFALGFLLRLYPAMITVSIVGLVFLEIARPKIKNFWPLTFFWLGFGLAVMGLVNRLYIYSTVPFLLCIVGAIWFLAQENPEKKTR